MKIKTDFFSDLIKVDDSTLTPHSGDLSNPDVPMADPVGDVFRKALDTSNVRRPRMSDAGLMKLFSQPLDVRDNIAIPAITTPALAKRASSWDKELFHDGGAPLTKGTPADDLYARERPSPFLYVRVEDTAAKETGAPLAKSELSSRMLAAADKFAADCVGDELDLLKAAARALDTSAFVQIAEKVVARLKANNQRMREQIQRATC